MYTSRPFTTLFATVLVALPLLASAQAVCPTAVRCSDGTLVGVNQSSCAYDCGDHGNPSLQFGTGPVNIPAPAAAPSAAAGTFGTGSTQSSDANPPRIVPQPGVFGGGVRTDSGAPVMSGGSTVSAGGSGAVSVMLGSDSVPHVLPATFGSVPAVVTPVSPLSDWYANMFFGGANAGGAAVMPGSDQTPRPTLCPAIARICPDGSIAKEGPNCSFDCAGHEQKPLVNDVECSDALIKATCPNGLMVVPVPGTCNAYKCMPPVSAATSSCTKPALHCDNGTTINPGADCEFHLSCADVGNTAGQGGVQGAGSTGVQLSDQGTILPPQANGQIVTTFYASPGSAPLPSSSSFGMRVSTLLGGFAGWFGGLFR